MLRFQIWIHLDILELFEKLQKYNLKFKMSFFWWFLVTKKVIWKNDHSVGPVTDCFEPIFGFLRSVWFEKCRSAPWNRIGMFSELSGHSDNAFFSCIFILLIVSRLKKVWNCFLKRPTHLSHFEKFLPTRLLGPTRLLNFKISSHLHCYSDSTLIQHHRVHMSHCYFTRLNL